MTIRLVYMSISSHLYINAPYATTGRHELIMDARGATHSKKVLDASIFLFRMCKPINCVDETAFGRDGITTY